MKTPHQAIVDILARGALGDPELVATEILAALAPSIEAIELAYGLLWGTPVYTRTPEGLAISLARQALLDQLDGDGQARGIARARKAFEAARDSRKNSRAEG
jgi:hypothetical protein